MTHVTLTFIAVATLGSAISSTLTADQQMVFSSSYYLLTDACQEIARSVSAASEVHDVASINYLENIRHWASSSTRFAACSFEPGTPEDVGIALRILGQTQTPFAVKGGGHTANAGFSSTEGVQVSMSRFSSIVYNSTAQTVTIGAGLVWDDVYMALEPHEVNVVGGRVPGVGVAGFILGGGYSWLTNQYGLTIDTVQAFELVLPNGTVSDITETSSPDLFFALRGGMNNFGIVTRFTLKTFPQTQVWGGMILYTADALDMINVAIANFAANNMDPKAALTATYSYFFGEPLPIVVIFYDAPTKPAGIFDEFLAISPSTKDIATRSFPAFVQSIPGFSPTRAVFDSISVTGYSLSFLQLIVNETTYWTKTLLKSVSFIGYAVEPFLPTLLAHNTTPSAYPPDRMPGFFPTLIYYAWELPEFDQIVQDAVRTSVQRLCAHLVNDGQSVANTIVYPNYAIFDTPLVKLYGANVPRLQAIKKAVDPGNVMGLAGGFKL